MRKTLAGLGVILFSLVTAHGQSNLSPDRLPLIETQSAQISSTLIDPSSPLSVHVLPDAPKPIQPVLPVPAATPCPAGVGKPCALLGGRLYFRDPGHMTEHDKSWADAMKSKGILLGVTLNAASFVFDYKTTRHCIDTHQGAEGNPLMGQSRAQELSVGISVTALAYFFSGKAKEQGQGNIAFAILAGGTALHLYEGSRAWAICHN
jgi:hypothetical protein